MTAAELEKAKNQIVTGQLQQRETSLGKSLALGRAAVVFEQSISRQHRPG